VREIAVGYIGEGLRLTNARARAGRAGEEKTMQRGGVANWQWRCGVWGRRNNISRRGSRE
jgi:hypothetical protein